MNVLDDTSRGGAKLVFHLHGLHDDQALTLPDPIADLHIDAYYQTGHRGRQRGWAGGLRRQLGEFANRRCPLVQRFGVKAISVDRERVITTLGATADDDT